MSIIDTFDVASEEILKPTDISEAMEEFPDTVVVTFHDTILSEVKNMPGAKLLCEMNAGAKLPVYQIRYNGRDIAVYRTLIGGAGSAGLLEEVIAKGGRQFVFFGSCGTLDQSLPAGHLIVPVAAYRDEGVSYHYLPASDYITVDTAGRLASILTEIGVPYTQGKVWTTDAIYRETRNNAAARRNDGCIAVEMECASVMAVGRFRQIPVYQYLYAEDNLDGEAWDRRTMGSVASSTLSRYLQVALEIASRL